MYPYLLPEIFGYNLPMYDLLIMIGIFVMLAYLARRFEKRDGISREATNKLLIYIVLSLLIALLSSYVVDGVFHFIGDYSYWREQGYTFFEIVKESFGSITFIGGLIGGVGAFILLYKYAFKYDRKNLRVTMNSVITGVVIAHAFGRLGCYFAGCCYGIPTESFLGASFVSGDSHGVSVYPTQLFESIFLFGLFAALNLVNSFKNRELEVYLVAYGTFRFLNEFLRGDDRGSIFGFINTEYNSYPSPSQYLSLIMIALGIFFIIKRKKQANLKGE